MYQKTIALILSGLLATAAGVVWNAGEPATELDYLARESLPEDLPEIPGPPRSAERTLYDTLRGDSRGAKSTRPAASGKPTQKSDAGGASGEDLPFLPVRRAAAPESANPPGPAPRLERVSEPVPAPQASTGNQKQAANRNAVSSGNTEAAASPSRPPGPSTITTAKRNAERDAQTEVSKDAAKGTRQEGSKKTDATRSVPKESAKTEEPSAQTTGKNSKAAPGSRRTLGKHDPQIPPTPRGKFRYYAPEYYRGIYLNNGVVRDEKRYEKLFEQSRKHKINTLVADVQPRFPSKEFIRAAREGGFYLVARVVVFEGGLKQPSVPEAHLNKVLDVAEQAARSGFMEIQLDYIRFADRARIGNLNLKQRYHIIASILKMATERLRPQGVRVGAYIFGRIPFNQNDRIGQRMEVFSAHLDTLYPMLYPSHFYGDPSYIKDPYKTIYQGQKKSIERVGDVTRSIAYIQGFKMKVGPSGLSYHNYIREQIDAAADSGGAGFVVWNARSSYGPFFKALADHDRRRAR
ncbi:MAG: putative glycoside hydrolase [Leptospirales bacterium]